MIEYSLDGDINSAELLIVLDSEPFCASIRESKSLCFTFLSVSLSELDEIEDELIARTFSLLDLDFAGAFDCLCSLASLCPGRVSFAVVESALAKLPRFVHPVCRFLRKFVKRNAIPDGLFTCLCEFYLNDRNSDVLDVIEIIFRVHGDLMIDITQTFLDLKSEARELSLHLFSFLVLYSSFRTDHGFLLPVLDDPSMRIRRAALWALHVIVLRISCFEYVPHLMFIMSDHPKNAMFACEIIGELARSDEFPFLCEVFESLVPFLGHPELRLALRSGKCLEIVISHGDDRLIPSFQRLLESVRNELILECIDQFVRGYTFRLVAYVEQIVQFCASVQVLVDVAIWQMKECVLFFSPAEGLASLGGKLLFALADGASLCGSLVNGIEQDESLALRIRPFQVFEVAEIDEGFEFLTRMLDALPAERQMPWIEIGVETLFDLQKADELRPYDLEAMSAFMVRIAANHPEVLCALEADIHHAFAILANDENVAMELSIILEAFRFQVEQGRRLDEIPMPYRVSSRGPPQINFRARDSICDGELRNKRSLKVSFECSSKSELRVHFHRIALRTGRRVLFVKLNSNHFGVFLLNRLINI
jgi:hypothetical protein